MAQNSRPASRHLARLAGVINERIKNDLVAARANYTAAKQTSASPVAEMNLKRLDGTPQSLPPASGKKK